MIILSGPIITFVPGKLSQFCRGSYQNCVGPIMIILSVLRPEPEPEPEPKPEPKRVPESNITVPAFLRIVDLLNFTQICEIISHTPKPKSQPETKTEPAPGPNPEPNMNLNLKFEPEPKPKCEPKPELEPEPNMRPALTITVPASPHIVERVEAVFTTMIILSLTQLIIIIWRGCKLLAFCSFSLFTVVPEAFTCIYIYSVYVCTYVCTVCMYYMYICAYACMYG